MKLIISNKILLPLLLFIFLIAGTGECAMKAITGKISDINPSGNRIIIITDENSKKQILINSQTRFYKKKRPLPADMKAGITDFSEGDRVTVITPDPSSTTPTAREIWGDKAFAVKSGLIQTEKNYVGEIINFDNTTGVIHLRTYEGKIIKADINNTTRIIFNNEKGQLSDIRPGTKAAIYCRWKGFEEDEPAVPDVSEFIDSKTYVIRKYGETYGPLISSGKVTGVMISDRSIKVATPDGIVADINFSRTTRWITATPKIKSPADFSGYEVYIFGKPGSGKIPVATMVMNIMGVNSIFQSLQRSGGVEGAVQNLAFGKVIYIDATKLIVLNKGQKIRIKLLSRTICIRKNRRIKWNDISRGETVSVKGIFGDPPIALMIRSFGKIK